MEKVGKLGTAFREPESCLSEELELEIIMRRLDVKDGAKFLPKSTLNGRYSNAFELSVVCFGYRIPCLYSCHCPFCTQTKKNQYTEAPHPTVSLPKFTARRLALNSPSGLVAYSRPIPI